MLGRLALALAQLGLVNPPPPVPAVDTATLAKRDFRMRHLLQGGRGRGGRRPNRWWMKRAFNLYSSTAERNVAKRLRRALRKQAHRAYSAERVELSVGGRRVREI